MIRDSVLSALEGHPRHTAKAAMEDGDRSLKSVTSALDQVYGGTTTYTTLLNKLNSVQQGYDETAKDYYECVLQIRVKLQEFHAYMFCKGDLEHKTKEAFFNGLRSEYQAMVMHKRDDPMIGTTDLLSAVRKCEENQENNRRNCRAEYAKAYPPSHSHSTYRDDWKARVARRHQCLPCHQMVTDTETTIAAWTGMSQSMPPRWNLATTTAIRRTVTTCLSM